jgi:hypothetical protein
MRCRLTAADGVAMREEQPWKKEFKEFKEFKAAEGRRRLNFLSENGQTGRIEMRRSML